MISVGVGAGRSCWWCTAGRVEFVGVFDGHGWHQEVGQEEADCSSGRLWMYSHVFTSLNAFSYPSRQCSCPLLPSTLSHRRTFPWHSFSCLDHPFNNLIAITENRRTLRPKKDARRKQSAAAMVIQRWQRQLRWSRVEAVRAREELARRRWAVDRLHAAYAGRWQFAVAVRRERRRKLEEQREQEEVRVLARGSRNCVFCMRGMQLFLRVNPPPPTTTTHDSPV